MTQENISINRLFCFSLANNLKVRKAQISLLAVTDTGSIPLAELTVDTANFHGVAQQSFEIPFDSGSYSYFFICAQLLEVESAQSTTSLDNQTLELLTIFDADSTLISLNEPNTIASAFTFNQFTSLKTDSEFPSMDYQFSQATGRVCYGMKNNFCRPDGNIARVIKNSPNAMETNSYALFNSLSNLVYYSIIDSAFYQSFLQIETTAENTFFSSLLFLIRNPFHEVESIYNLATSQTAVYTPSLAEINAPEGQSAVPNQLTLTIKLNQTGGKNFLFGGPAFVVFDKHDRAWIVNNVRQGTPNSGTFCVILEPDGSPASFSPLFGGGILGGGFGITANYERDKIFIGNYGWGPTQCNPQYGGVAGFHCDGRAITPADGYTNHLSRVQGLNFDRHGNLWMSSWGTQNPLAPAGGNYYPYESQNSAVVVYLDADEKKAVYHEFDGPGHCTFDVIITDNDIAYVSNAGSSDDGANGNPVPSSLHKFQLQGDQLVCLASYYCKDFEGFRQVNLDQHGNVYVGAIHSNRIYRFSAQDTELKNPEAISCPEVNRAWGLIFDAENNLFVANFGKNIGSNKHHDSGLGVSLLPDGDPSQAKVMTVPSGGDEVMLPNGFPLYGKQTFDNKHNRIVESTVWPPCYQPLMRLTSTNIDRAGNLWAINNWKPSGINDLTENPGGDGAVIFIGVAKPIIT